MARWPKRSVAVAAAQEGTRLGGEFPMVVGQDRLWSLARRRLPCDYSPALGPHDDLLAAGDSSCGNQTLLLTIFAGGVYFYLLLLDEKLQGE